MTSNVLPTPYVSSASTEYDATLYKASNVFDGSATTYWVSNGSPPAWIKLDLGFSGAQTVRSFAIMAGDLGHVTQAPKDFTFEGSNDNSTWNTLKTVTGQTGWAASEVRTFNNTSVASYRYYRLNVSANVAGTINVRVAELYFYQEAVVYTYTMTGFSGGTNGATSPNFTVTPNFGFIGTITPSDGGNGGTFTPTSLTWTTGSEGAQTFTYTPASIGAKTISATNNSGATDPAALTYYSVVPYTILPTDLWNNAYSTNETDYYLSSPLARLVAQTDATGLSFTVWRTSAVTDSSTKVAVVVNGVATVFTATTVGTNTFNLDGLATGQKTIEIIASMQWRGTPRTGTFLNSIEWFGANTTITPPGTSNRIIIYGDSTMAGFGTANPPTEAPGILIYNHYVNRSVLDESWASRRLIDDSTGTTVNQSLIDHLTLGNPTHIWLAIGINDYKDGGQWSASDFGIAYGNLLDRLHNTAPNAKIIAQTPLIYYQGDGEYTNNDGRSNLFGNYPEDYRVQIRTLAATRPWVTLVEGTSFISGYNGGHPNTAQSAAYAISMESYLDLSPDATTSTSSTSTSSCGDSITAGTPDLFEIRTNKNTATLYFAPPTAPYSSFYIAYSRKPDVLEYGVEYNQSYAGNGGVLKYTINMLQPNTKYYFKIRAGNGCATGNWGNTITATTTSSTAQRTYYKNFPVVINNLLPRKENTNSLVTSPSPSSTPKPTMEIQTPTPIQTNLPVQVQPVPKPKFCILWWCF